MLRRVVLLLLALMLPLQSLASASSCAHWHQGHGDSAAAAADAGHAHRSAAHCDQGAHAANANDLGCDHCGYCQLAHGVPLARVDANTGADARFDLNVAEPTSPAGHIPDLLLRPPRRA